MPSLLKREVGLKPKTKIALEGLSVIHQLIQARHDADMTQQQVADIMGVSHTVVSEIERATRVCNGPSITKIIRYARAVGLEAIQV